MALVAVVATVLLPAGPAVLGVTAFILCLSSGISAKAPWCLDFIHSSASGASSRNHLSFANTQNKRYVVACIFALELDTSFKAKGSPQT